MNPHHHSTLGAFKQTTLKSHINLAKPAASLALSHFSTSQIYAVLGFVLLGSLSAMEFNADSLWRSYLPLNIQNRKITILVPFKTAIQSFFIMPSE